ncbi:Alpha/Beta hydrolase protein [Sparassis latifolia]
MFCTLFSRRPKENLTPAQKRMYALERLDNYRTLARLTATRSRYTLTSSDLVSAELQVELAQLGQFAELAYAWLDPEFVFANVDVLSRTNFPFEGYDALQEATLISSFRGVVADVPALVIYRGRTRQLVVGFSGTASLRQGLYDVHANMKAHPSGPACAVHSGFWKMYLGCKAQAFEGVRKGLREHEVIELVVTGHSMGAALAFLFALDVLTADPPLQPGLRVKVAAFGSPRFGNEALSGRWQEIVEAYMAANGENAVTDYLVKAYNDGIPSLPPSIFGYAHLARTALYFYHGQLFHTPVSQREHGVFNVAGDALDPARVPEHPRGGHNYYNGRDWEKIIRRMRWLKQVMETGSGEWEKGYISQVAQAERVRK